MGWIASLRNLFAPPRVAGKGDLRAFIESRAAYLVQKSIMEYTQARANMLFSTLMREPIFLESYERARWQSFPAAVSMVTEMVEGTLRERSNAAPGSLDAALQHIVSDIVGRYPGPSGLPTEFWAEVGARVGRDLAKAALGPPKPVQNIPMERVVEIFDVLPVNTQLKQHDFDMFRNTIRFHLTQIKVEFEERLALGQLLEALRA